MCYEDKLKPLLLQKLKHIEELQICWVIGTMETIMSTTVLHGEVNSFTHARAHTHTHTVRWVLAMQLLCGALV